ncbi:uncharacterized protein LOC105841128 [Monomorium pharaonis]|uniref:uncharacterized protein LOC105841128 n=2 Tax=Monomorium pharaonis TaxID=307658 RepID=UPI00063F6FE3|nr:uncharacterized protein LOC105841128 [Monomorium pharaonis]
MESGDEDIFAISDEEMLSPARVAPVNPVEEHLQKELADVESRIDLATREIAETRETTARVLNALEWRALYGEDASSDSDSELYTVEGAPVVKKPKNHRTSIKQNLEIISQWQCVLSDKWIIGIKLNNISYCTLLNPRYYPYVLSTRDEQISGVSTFWKEKHDFYSEKIDSIQPGIVVATMVLDLGCYPMFDKEPVVECWGIISYEIDETQFQIPVPPIQLSITETINSSCIKFLDKNKYDAILAVKSTSAIERVINIKFVDGRFDQDTQDDQSDTVAKFFSFLTAKTFTKICDHIFLMKEHGFLMYCLLEVQSINYEKANIRIFARSVNQLNIILRLLRDEFPKVCVENKTDDSLEDEIDVETDIDCVEAAMALIRELELIRDKKSIHEIQEAKVITDLFIP